MTNLMIPATCSAGHMVDPRATRICEPCGMKRCTHCHQWKSFADFPPTKHTPSQEYAERGLHCRCRLCKSMCAKEARLRKKEGATR